MNTNEPTYEGDRDYLDKWSRTSCAFDNKFIKKDPGDPTGRINVTFITAEFPDENFVLIDQAFLDIVRYKRTNDASHIAHAVALLEQLANEIEIIWLRQYTDEHYCP